jgi:hypothetical protein
MWEAQIGGSKSWPAQAKSQTLLKKQKKTKLKQKGLWALKW